MPLPFASIPEQIRLSVVQKIDAHDFGQFKECSRVSYKTSRKIRTKLIASTENEVFLEINNGELKYRIKFFGWFEAIEWSVRAELLENTPIRLVAEELYVKGFVTQEICEKLVSSFRWTMSSFEYLCIVSGIQCTQETFNSLLLGANCSKFICTSSIPNEFMKIPAIKNLDRLDVMCFVDDEDLLTLKMPRLYLRGTNITSSGLNLFIKEYFDKKRDIIDVYIELSSHTVDKEIVRKDLNVFPENSSTNDDQSQDSKKKKNNKRPSLDITYYGDSAVKLCPSDD